MAEIKVNIPDITLVVKGLVAGDISGSWLDGLNVREVDISAGDVASITRTLRLTNPNAVPATIEQAIDWSAAADLVVSDIQFAGTIALPFSIPAADFVDVDIVYTIKTDAAHEDTVVISGGGVAVTEE